VRPADQVTGPANVKRSSANAVYNDIGEAPTVTVPLPRTADLSQAGGCPTGAAESEYG
jgi:hypothetical protein